MGVTSFGGVSFFVLRFCGLWFCGFAVLRFSALRFVVLRGVEVVDSQWFSCATVSCFARRQWLNYLIYSDLHTTGCSGRFFDLSRGNYAVILALAKDLLQFFV